MRVIVNPPHIDGETVHFRWEQSAPNPYQAENAFYFRYEGVDLTQFTNALFYELFLGLQMKVFAAYDEVVEVVFPEPISPFTVAYWTAFYSANRVEIGPLASSGSYSPWKSDTPPTPRRPYGVLFGGGKDSTLATCLLSEIYGADQVVLFQLVCPQRQSRREMKRIEHRQDQLMLQPAREQLGVATQRAWTDYFAQLGKPGRILRPHLELYSVGFLPVLLDWGISLLTPSFPWSAFPYQKLANGSLWFRYPMSRPEMMASQALHYQRTFDFTFTLTNLNLLFTTISAYRMLIERYPDPFSRIVMCVGADRRKRWCFQCHKCAEYAIFGLANGIYDPRFDYNLLFESSRYVQKLIAYIETGVERSVYGNVPWAKFVGTDTNYLIDCHAFAQVEPQALEPYLSLEAMTNLRTIKAAFGNTSFPYALQVPGSAIELLGHETARLAATIAADHFDIVDPIPGPFLAGNTPVEYDFHVRMPIKTGNVVHIRS